MIFSFTVKKNIAILMPYFFKMKWLGFFYINITLVSRPVPFTNSTEFSTSELKHI